MRDSSNDCKYNPDQDYCDEARRSQSVLNEEQTRHKLEEQGKASGDKDILEAREGTLYSCPDNYQMASIQDNEIYIATTDNQHNQIAKGEHVDAHGGLSGYFSDKATVDVCKNDDSLDNTKYNEACQIAPHRKDGANGIGDATYKSHVDCFEIDRNRMQEVYGTQDFNAAIAKCEANNQFGSGGGNQGYNPHISEMIDNRCLRHSESKSYSDSSISKSEHNNPNQLTNSVVYEDRADKMFNDGYVRSSDCVVNETPHPSPEACNNGFPKENAISVDSNTGHATPVNRDIDLKSDFGFSGSSSANTSSRSHSVNNGMT